MSREAAVVLYRMDPLEIAGGWINGYDLDDFVAAVAAAAGFWGWTGRTATMRHLFGDLLPRAVLERNTKAIFTDAVFTEHTREFARRWDGDGVDTALVDPEELRENWLSTSPHASSMALLQQAWLGTQPIGNEGTGHEAPQASQGA